MENLEKVFHSFFEKKKSLILQRTSSCSSKESATLANRLIEGQVLNAQYAEESYQLKRENSTYKKQIEEINQSLAMKPTSLEISSSNLLQTSNHNELEILHERIDCLAAVRISFEMPSFLRIILLFSTE